MHGCGHSLLSNGFLAHKICPERARETDLIRDRSVQPQDTLIGGRGMLHEIERNPFGSLIMHVIARLTRSEKLRLLVGSCEFSELFSPLFYCLF